MVGRAEQIRRAEIAKKHPDLYDIERRARAVHVAERSRRLARPHSRQRPRSSSLTAEASRRAGHPSGVGGFAAAYGRIPDDGVAFKGRWRLGLCPGQIADCFRAHHERVFLFRDELVALCACGGLRSGNAEGL